MKFVDNWESTKIKWDNYWKRQNSGTPLMYVTAKKQGVKTTWEHSLFAHEDKCFNAKLIDASYRQFCAEHDFLAEGFPNLSVDLGPGSMAAYLGCDVAFSGGSVWYDEFIKDWDGVADFAFDPKSVWFNKHLQTFKEVVELSKGDYYVGIPDIMDNIDVIASMRGAQDTIFDLMDEPEEIHRRIQQVQDLYYTYCEQFYQLAKQKENGVDSSAYTVFNIWGRGKTIKFQCDFSAMMSPTQVREFIVPALSQVIKQSDNSLYHLDGPDAIKHVDAIMEIEELNALQWTSGSYNPDGTHEQWFGIYDKVAKAGKGLWVQVYNGNIHEQIARIDKLVKRYGTNALFMKFEVLEHEEAHILLEHAEKNWRDIEGDYLKSCT